MVSVSVDKSTRPCDAKRQYSRMVFFVFVSSLSLCCDSVCVCVCVCVCVAFFPAYKITLVSLIKSELLTKKTDLLHVLNIIACAVKAGDST